MSELRVLHKNTMRTLGKPHVLPTLTVTWLFCLLSGMAAVLFCRFCLVLATIYLPFDVTDLLSMTALPVLAVGFAVFLVFPCFLGRLRMAGLLLEGEIPLYADCFYYFGARARYCRAVGISAVLLVVYGLAGLAIFGSFAGALSLYRGVLTFYLPEFAIPLLIILLFVALAAAAGVLYLTGALLPFAALAVGNESLPLTSCFQRALRVGRQNLFKSFLFTMGQLLCLVICLLSVMTLYALWYSHYFNLIYLRYAMALFKEDSQ